MTSASKTNRIEGHHLEQSSSGSQDGHSSSETDIGANCHVKDGSVQNIFVYASAEDVRHGREERC